LEFNDTELAHYLGISVERARQWIKDEADTHADESAKFHRLIQFIEAANGVIRVDRLGHWIHTPNKALNGIMPMTFLADPVARQIVLSLLDDLRTGAAA